MVMRTYESNRYSWIRREMLDDTVRFLSWALKRPEYFPRIPRVRVDDRKEIRFSEKIKKAVWGSVLQALRNIPYEF